MTERTAISFWKTVSLLLKLTRRRSVGRMERQQQLLNNRSGRNATNWGVLGTLVSVIFTIILHGAAAYAVISSVEVSQLHEAERSDKTLVQSEFLSRVWRLETARDEEIETAKSSLEAAYRVEAEDIAERSGGDVVTIEKRLRAEVAATGSRNLISLDYLASGLANLAKSGPVAAMLGSFMLLWWFAMVVCQGEGLELDLQRRRHPMWEWLLSHPVNAGAVFFAEMLSPLSANPTYWTAPLFAGFLYGSAYDAYTGFAAALLIGIPVTIAAACVGKALEIGALLRLPVRSRGAVIGILGWFGYAAMLAMFLGPALLSRVVASFSREIDAISALPSPWLGLFLGLGSDGSVSFLRGMLACWIISAAIIAIAVVFSARSVRNGLSGAFASDKLRVRPERKAKFGQRPLYRKEYLWFVRDRSAIVQTILIPVTIAGFQLVNLRGLLSHVGDSWNYLSGAAIFFGTYFLWVLGPKSLISEGSALWLALSWPHGLESMLKAKAWLWSMISSGIVAAVLIAACWLFPHDAWKIALVGLGWFVFSRSMAEKSVTLVTVVSESGEAEKIPAGRRWAAQLGMLTFGIGICTQTWSLAVVGIVYSWITAAAMWENLRARLPYLYDPWSEQLPNPPTLMHAMVSISILIECAAVVTGFMIAFGGKDSLAVAQGFGYALCSVAVMIGVSKFLSDRGVEAAQIWCWRDDQPESRPPESWLNCYVAANRRDLGWLACGIGGGLLLGLVAHFYLAAISLVPSIAELIRAGQLEMKNIPEMATAYAIMAIGFAPVAEEFLFRGLVFRALDKMWRGWSAALGAAAFFAIYHPPLAWPPVWLVGVANCLLFKFSKRLAPAILLHMAYNMVVVLWT